MLKLGTDIRPVPEKPSRPITIGLDETIFKVLKEFPFRSFRTLVSNVKHQIKGERRQSEKEKKKSEKEG
jgi:hypothetical protein